MVILNAFYTCVQGLCFKSPNMVSALLPKYRPQEILIQVNNYNNHTHYIIFKKPFTCSSAFGFPTESSDHQMGIWNCKLCVFSWVHATLMVPKSITFIQMGSVIKIISVPPARKQKAVLQQFCWEQQRRHQAMLLTSSLVHLFCSILYKLNIFYSTFKHCSISKSSNESPHYSRVFNQSLSISQKRRYGLPSSVTQAPFFPHSYAYLHAYIHRHTFCLKPLTSVVSFKLVGASF